MNKKQLLEKYNEYFENLFKGVDDSIKLDDEQRNVIVDETDNLMVIAGAGSGKTTTICAKVKYLIEVKGVSPSRIMLISLTNKAVNELNTRLNKDFGLGVSVFTFHKLCYNLLKINNNKCDIISDNGNIIENYIKDNLINDKYMLNKFLKFFLFYFDFGNCLFKNKSFFEYMNYKRKIEFRSLCSMREFNNTIINNSINNNSDMNGQFMGYYSEVLIANFLFINGIKYTYKGNYMFDCSYVPDFTIYIGDRKYYIDFFAFCRQELYKYKKGINKIRKLHKKNNTEMIEIYDGDDVCEILTIAFKKYNILLNPMDDYELFNILFRNNSSLYYKRFIKFCSDFILAFKKMGYDESFFDNIYDDRTNLFLSFMKDLYKYYINYLEKNNLVDFEDLIIKATKLLNDDSSLFNYDYLIVDEYQDISLTRFELVKIIRKVCRTHIMVVGDDWQSIFGFSGSNINLFTDFSRLMGGATVLKITNTYRNSQELINLAGKFVMKNRFQIRKRLRSSKRINNCFNLILYDDDFVCKLVSVLDSLVDIYGINKNVLLLGRYNFDINKVMADDRFTIQRGGKIIFSGYPKLSISFMSVHSSKGLGYDNVIIINGEGGVLGFPSSIMNDPIMDLVSFSDNSYSFAEERRLFYVAMTRTKNQVFVMAPRYNISSFITELTVDKTVVCPKCGGNLFKRKSMLHGVKYEYLCVNEKICGFSTNNLKVLKEIKPCHLCDGMLLIKFNGIKYFYGCSNFYKGCKATMNID